MKGRKLAVMQGDVLKKLDEHSDSLDDTYARDNVFPYSDLE